MRRLIVFGTLDIWCEKMEVYVMLKKIIFFSLALCLLLSIGSYVCATENMVEAEDSKLINVEIVKMLDAGNAESVLRIYNIPITVAFAAYDDIHSVLSSEEFLGEYYALKTTDNHYTYKIREADDFVPVKINNISQQALEMCQTGEVSRYIASDVVVNNTYYLSGEACRMGSAIYYETNKGDYVYFNHLDVGEKLFPIEAFCAYQRAILDEASQYPDRVGSACYSQVWDLSPYDFRSDSFNPNAEIPASHNTVKDNRDTSDYIDPTEVSGENMVTTGKIHDDNTNDTSRKNEGNNYNWFYTTIMACLLITGIAGLVIYWRRMNKVKK